MGTPMTTPSDIVALAQEDSPDATHRAILSAADAIGELQLAATLEHDEVVALRQQCRDLQHAHDRMRNALQFASGHTCDARQRCAKCGIPTTDPRRLAGMFSEMRGWVGALCPTCANGIEAEFDGDPKIARADGDVL